MNEYKKIYINYTVEPFENENFCRANWQLLSTIVLRMLLAYICCLVLKDVYHSVIIVNMQHKVKAILKKCWDCQTSKTVILHEMHDIVPTLKRNVMAVDFLYLSQDFIGELHAHFPR